MNTTQTNTGRWIFLPDEPFTEHQFISTLRNAKTDNKEELDLRNKDIEIDAFDPYTAPDIFLALNDLLQKESFKALYLKGNPCAEDTSCINFFTNFYPNAPTNKIKTQSSLPFKFEENN
eukprot:gb/GECH01002627.1/.p1 GENE.gb/GECH01002627.1/~~gb/GECH01002627.1/.p1  ORF type:complete len:119 (+),score=11.02 gb/GECH01002627.1/:1-357(+)